MGNNPACAHKDLIATKRSCHGLHACCYMPAGGGMPCCAVVDLTDGYIGVSALFKQTGNKGLHETK
jgi:hypothetical protein